MVNEYKLGTMLFGFIMGISVPLFIFLCYFEVIPPNPNLKSYLLLIGITTTCLMSPSIIISGYILFLMVKRRTTVITFNPNRKPTLKENRLHKLKKINRINRWKIIKYG